MNDNNDGLNPDPQSIKDIPFDQLVLPPYQRPYKWKAKHVNQLITDIATFKNNAQYRLGTLVLYRNKEKINSLEIVDGQQRIVTLTLLIKILSEKFLAGDSIRQKQYDEVTCKVNSFIKKTNFTNPHSLHNVVKNIHVSVCLTSLSTGVNLWSSRWMTYLKPSNSLIHRMGGAKIWSHMICSKPFT